MKIIITGGFGYLGTNLSNFLADRGHDIRVFSRSKIMKTKMDDKYEVILGDILNKRKISEACKDIDFAIHLAALDQHNCKKNPELALRVNGIGTRIVLEAAKKLRVKRLIYMSTLQVYGKLRGKVTEQTLPIPINDYGLSKLLGEYYCMQADNGMECAIARLSNAYGPILTASSENLVFNLFCKQSVEKQKIVLKSKGTQKRDFIAIYDVCQAIDKLLNSELKGFRENIFNVGGENALSIRESAELIAKTYFELYGKKVKIELDKNPVEEQTADFVYDISRIKKLGFRPKAKIKEEIKKTLMAFEQLKNG